jgi:hypothetical protein
MDRVILQIDREGHLWRSFVENGRRYCQQCSGWDCLGNVSWYSPREASEVSKHFTVIDDKFNQPGTVFRFQ